MNFNFVKAFESYKKVAEMFNLHALIRKHPLRWFYGSMIPLSGLLGYLFYQNRGLRDYLEQYYENQNIVMDSQSTDNLQHLSKNVTSPTLGAAIFFCLHPTFDDHRNKYSLIKNRHANYLLNQTDTNAFLQLRRDQVIRLGNVKEILGDTLKFKGKIYKLIDLNAQVLTNHILVKHNRINADESSWYTELSPIREKYRKALVELIEQDPFTDIDTKKSVP